jgi:3',5'-cyclic AMP phosphodiesterase CpdA
MKRVVWLTDIHLNFLPDESARQFLSAVARAAPDALVISGDIAESPSITRYLALISETVAAPVYFVLGNHDFYHGSIAETRMRVAKFCASDARLHYLSGDGVVELTAHVGLVGHDGWADGRLGDFERSLVVMNDHRLIRELTVRDRRARWEVLQALGDEAAEHVGRGLAAAFERFRDVLLVTHVPPFRDACWHEGAISNDDWAPHFTCAAMGQAIDKCMRARPDRRLTVLCGHTHGGGECQPLANVQVLTGAAEYGKPAISRIFEFD